MDTLLRKDQLPALDPLPQSVPPTYGPSRLDPLNCLWGHLIDAHKDLRTNIFCMISSTSTRNRTNTGTNPIALAASAIVLALL